MACYVSFPLTAMFLFSRPELFKDRVIEARKRYHPPPNPERVKNCHTRGSFFLTGTSFSLSSFQDELIQQLKERERLRRESEVLEQMSQFQSKQRETGEAK